MRLHLPYSESPQDEFQGADGQWYSIYRAISFDSWLLWKHALPDDLALRRLLTAEVEATIRRLADALHAAHQHFPDYKRLLDSPFQISHWWDPTDDSGAWSTGGRLLCRVQDYSAPALEAEIKRRSRSLRLVVRSLHWIEISLPPEELVQPAALAAAAEAD